MSEIADEEVTLDEYVNAALEDRIAMIRVATPAVVAAYHASTQTVDVNLPVNRQVQDGNGGFTSEPQPSLKGIKARYPRCRKFTITFPLVKGDTGVIVCCDRSIQQWRAHGASGDPGDLGMHTLDGAYFEPGLDDDDNTPAADGTNMIIGSHDDGPSRIEIKPSGGMNLGAGATQFVAMANKVKAWLDAFNTAVGGWTPVAMDGGAALKTALATIIAGTPTTDVASSNVKALD